ncbi:hypothetical protein RUND412_007566 [Rhizina undulata]
MTPPSLSTANNPTLHHFTHLLSHLTHSETSLSSLHQRLHQELVLLQTYFSTSAAELADLKPLCVSPDRETRRAAVERRRRRWAEMERMERWREGVLRVLENVARREENEKRVRGMLKELGGALLEREVLVMEGVGCDVVL